ncbi:acyl-CoA dehydrogenase family protein [Pseudomonas sp. PCH446]
MFTMMNHARLGTGMQGLCLGETSFQGAVRYANDRLQMRSLTGPKAPDKAADPIIVHPDVRRMLLTMKAFNEGNRALTYFTAQWLDVAHLGTEASQRQEAEDLLAFLTPICKAFMTETGLEVTNHGMQVFGGHGFIREWAWSSWFAIAGSRRSMRAPTGFRRWICWGARCSAARASCCAALPGSCSGSVWRMPNIRSSRAMRRNWAV